MVFWLELGNLLNFKILQFFFHSLRHHVLVPLQSRFKSCGWHICIFPIESNLFENIFLHVATFARSAIVCVSVFISVIVVVFLSMSQLIQFVLIEFILDFIYTDSVFPLSKYIYIISFTISFLRLFRELSIFLIPSLILLYLLHTLAVIINLLLLPFMLSSSHLIVNRL